MFFSKKPTNQEKFEHYEGLEGFQWGTSCTLTVNAGTLTFAKTKPDLAVNLSISQLQGIEFMSELNFMTQYHSEVSDISPEAVETFVWVIHYTDNAGNAKYIVLVAAGNDKFMQSIKDQLPGA